jgi:hypothetical protein
MSSTEHSPPSCCLQPLHILDHLIASSLRGSSSSSEPGNNNTESSSLHQGNVRCTGSKSSTTTACLPVGQLDEILKTVDFLYGSTLDGALSILDADPRRDILRVISLQSRRSLYIVKGRSSSSYGGRGASSSSGGANAGVDSSYMCMLPETPTLAEIAATATNAESQHDLYPPLYYCSCRSFLERCKMTTASSSSACLCKHLLALKLMPVLGIHCSVIETTSDEEFSKFALQRISVD